jgi:tyrosine ammonia-lyase
MMPAVAQTPAPGIDFIDPPDLAALAAIVTAQRPIALGAAVYDRMARAEAFLETLVTEKRCVYGVTTGFGPLASQHIDPAQGAGLQRNLVYHLASGVGAPYSKAQTRAIMVARLSSLTRGCSAVSRSAVDLLVTCLNRNLLPVIPQKGTVGASGDLTPLAHMTLALMGEGLMWTGDSHAPSDQVLAAHGLQPLDFTGREGLAFVNGTAAMTGVAALGNLAAQQAAQISMLLTVLYSEILFGHAEAYHTSLGQLRPHAGQIQAIQWLQQFADGSRLLKPIPARPPHIDAAASDASGVIHEQPLPQDPYSIRCAPQIYGAVLDVIAWHGTVVTTELAAVTDNPVFLCETGQVIHGGNFFGQHVAFASDALTTAIITMAAASERRIARITDASLNKGLPAFLQGNSTGLHSGFMGAQVTATALVAEMRSQAIPASIQTIPTNANNQDLVSMGTIAARKAADLLDDCFRVLAIEALCLAQAAELRQQAGHQGFAPATSGFVRDLRQISSFLSHDRPLGHEIERMALWLRETAGSHFST